MPIETNCQQCGQRLRVPDEHAGKRARCPQCGNIYRVASPQATERSSDSIRSTPLSTFETDRWHVRTADSRTFGPISRQELDQWVTEGRVSSDTLLRREEDNRWVPAQDVYAVLREESPASPFRKKTLPQDRSENPYQPPATSTETEPQQDSGQRVLQPHRGGQILTLGIVSLICCQILGPIAWVMGNSDLTAMRQGTMDPSGSGLTRAGMILGIIASILLAIRILARFGQGMANFP